MISVDTANKSVVGLFIVFIIFVGVDQFKNYRWRKERASN